MAQKSTAFIIADTLSTDPAEAMTGRQLAEYFNCDIRDITAEVERERRAGRPIVASASGGYCLAENVKALNDYCGRLHHRAAEEQDTKKSLLKIVKAWEPAEVKGGAE